MSGPLDAKAIRESIQDGESEQLEFKLRLPPEDVVARVLVAFANSAGGLLLIGVAETSDGAEVRGLTDAEVTWTVDRLRQLVSSVLPIPALVGPLEVEGRTIVYASVEALPPHLKPLTTATGQAFQREAGRNVLRPVEPVVVVDDLPYRAGTPYRVFVAMSFRQEEEPALVDYFRAMERAASQVRSGCLELVRIDRVEGDYEISTEIMNQIDECAAVLADFTLSPRNVYFEVGYARGRNKRIIQTARKDTLLEFDVRNWKTIFYRNATELEAHLVSEFAQVVE